MRTLPIGPQMESRLPLHCIKTYISQMLMDPRHERLLKFLDRHCGFVGRPTARRFVLQKTTITTARSGSQSGKSDLTAQIFAGFCMGGTILLMSVAALGRPTEDSSFFRPLVTGGLTCGHFPDKEIS